MPIVAAMMPQSTMQITMTVIRYCSVLTDVRLNSGRFSIGKFSKDIYSSHRDTRPSDGSQYAWQVFWLMVIRFLCTHLPRKFPSGFHEYALPYTVAGTASDLLPDGYSAPSSLLSFQPLASIHQA